VRVQGGGRRRVDDRAVLVAICYLAQAGCSWWKLPEALFGVTRPTAHRRFTEWTKAGPSPVDRGKPGSKIHAMSERGGLPLITAVSAANTPDAAVLLPLLDSMPTVAGN
jgi:hypothetical protein